MPVTRDEVERALQGRDPKLIAAVLEAAEVAYDEAEDAAALAKRLTAALWWRSHSPAGQLLMPDNLDQLVDRTGKRLAIELGDGDAWARLTALTNALVDADTPVDLESLDEDTRARLSRPVWGRLAGVGGAGSALGARWAASKLLALTVGPLWDLIMLIPKVGPALIAVRTAAGTVAAVSGPLAIGIALLTVNSALGARYDKALPLLLGIGLICRNPVVVRGAS